MTRPLLEVADVVRQYGADYLSRYGAVTSTAQRRVLQTVAQLPHGDAGWPQSPV